MSSRSKFLLSDDAKPRVGVPRAATHHKREYRLPTCIGRVPRGKAIHRAETKILGHTRRRPATAKPCASFRDRTLTWFKTGEDIEEQTAPFERDEVIVSRGRRRRLIIAGVSGGGFLMALAVLWFVAG